MRKYLLVIFMMFLFSLFAQINEDYISYETTSIIEKDTSNYQLYMIGTPLDNTKRDSYKEIIDHLIRDKNVRTIFFEGSISDEWIINQIKIYNSGSYGIDYTKKIIDRSALKQFRKVFPYLIDIDKSLLDSLQFYSLLEMNSPYQSLMVMSSILKKHSQFDASAEIDDLQGGIINIAEKDNCINILDSIIKKSVGTEDQLKNKIGEDYIYFNGVFMQLKMGLEPFFNDNFNFDSLSIVSAEIIKEKSNYTNQQRSLLITNGYNLIDKKDLKYVSAGKLYQFSTRLAILLPYKKCKIRHFNSKGYHFRFFPMLDSNIKLIKDIGKENKQYMIKLKYKDSPFRIDYDYIFYTK